MDRELALGLYRTMLLIRRFEEKLYFLFSTRDMPGSMHQYNGQEAVAAGVCAHLSRTDYITSTHRGHGHSIAKGADLRAVMAEIFAKSTGCCRGMGGSMHIADFGAGMLGANGIVAGGVPIAAGAGITCQVRGKGQVSAAFFGDGAVNEGAFHEAVNLASVWQLPVLFVCENNVYGFSTHYRRTMRLADIADRAAAYGIPGIVVNGMDVQGVYEAAGAAIRRAQGGRRPHPHRMQDLPIHGTLALRARRLPDQGGAGGVEGEGPPGALRGGPPAGIFRSARRSSTRWGRMSRERLRMRCGSRSRAPIPPPTTGGGTSMHETPAGPAVGAPAARSIAQALRMALIEEMERDPSVFLLGEDIAVFGGAYRVTEGLLARFGDSRVRDTPISEAAIIGAAVGAAMTGLRPVAEIQFNDFLACAMDQIVNQAAKMRFMMGGQVTVPLVIRAPVGATGRAAQHSQSLEAWFMHVPGLKVVFPSTPYDAKGLLKSAIRDDNPVMFFEHKLLYGGSSPGGKAKTAVDGLGEAFRPAPAGEYVVPFGVADVKRPGQGRDGGGHRAHGPQGPRRCCGARGRGDRGGGHRPADPRSAGPGGDRGLGEEDGAPGRGERGRAHLRRGIRKSPPLQPRRRSGRWTRRWCASPCRTPPFPSRPNNEAAVIPQERTIIHAVRSVLP